MRAYGIMNHLKIQIPDSIRQPKSQLSLEIMKTEQTKNQEQSQLLSYQHLQEAAKVGKFIASH